MNWNPAVAPVAHAPCLSETARWRNIFNIPAGYRGHFRVWVQGGKFENANPNSFGRFYYDGVLVDGNTELNALRHWSPYIPVTPGNHTLEWREGSMLVAQITNPAFGIERARIIRDTYPVNVLECRDLMGVVINQHVLDLNGNPAAPPVGYVLTMGECP